MEGQNSFILEGSQSRGCIAQWYHTCFLPNTPGFNARHSQEFFFDVAEIYWRVNSEQRLDNFNRTHLVLASGKLVIQKRLAKASYKLVASVNRSFEADPFQVEIENLAEERKKKIIVQNIWSEKWSPGFLNCLTPIGAKKTQQRCGCLVAIFFYRVFFRLSGSIREKLFIICILMYPKETCFLCSLWSEAATLRQFITAQTGSITETFSYCSLWGGGGGKEGSIIIVQSGVQTRDLLVFVYFLFKAAP